MYFEPQNQLRLLFRMTESQKHQHHNSAPSCYRFFNSRTQSLCACSEHWLHITMLIQAPAPAPIILPIPRTCLSDNSESQNTNFYSFKREHSLQQFQHKQIPPHKTCLRLNVGITETSL